MLEENDKNQTDWQRIALRIVRIVYLVDLVVQVGSHSSYLHMGLISSFSAQPRRQLKLHRHTSPLGRECLKLGLMRDSSVVDC